VGRTVIIRPTATPAPSDHRCSRATLDSSEQTDPNSTPTWNDAVSVCIDYALSSSTDAYASETRVSTGSSNPYLQFSGSLIGDYSGVAVSSTGSVFAVWTDGRGHPGVASDAAPTRPNQDMDVGRGF
jgi:hypothetical protein